MQHNRYKLKPYKDRLYILEGSYGYGGTGS